MEKTYPHDADVRREALAMAIDWHRDGGGQAGDILATAERFYKFLAAAPMAAPTVARSLTAKVREWDGASV